MIPPDMTFAEAILRLGWAEVCLASHARWERDHPPGPAPRPKPNFTLIGGTDHDTRGA